MKRPRPVKKLIRPIQHLRPIENPNLEKMQQSREVSNNRIEFYWENWIIILRTVLELYILQVTTFFIRNLYQCKYVHL